MALESFLPLALDPRGCCTARKQQGHEDGADQLVAKAKQVEGPGREGAGRVRCHANTRGSSPRPSEVLKTCSEPSALSATGTPGTVIAQGQRQRATVHTPAGESGKRPFLLLSIFHHEVVPFTEEEKEKERKGKRDGRNR